MWFMIPYYIIVCRSHYQHENSFLIFDLKRIHNKGNNKITELGTILQRESQNS
jgi:hypothetical protein